MAGLARRVRRTILLLAAMGIVIALIVFNPLRAIPTKDESDTAVLRQQSEITTASLSNAIEADGELVYSTVREIPVGGQGTITALIEAGTALEASTVLFRVDDNPTIALTGHVPTWRSMSEDDVGPDVAQLESNLVELGYDPDAALSVDETFTSYTADLVALWQEDLGVEVTGSVALGAVVFVPEAAQVLAVSGFVGQQANGATVLSVAAPDRHIVFDVDAGDLETIAVGTEVSARLPDRSTFSATVTDVRPAGSGTWSATASLNLAADRAALPGGISVPLAVSWVDQVASDVTTVRANALTRLDTGAYTLEVVNDDLTTSFVEVGIGASAGSIVEIVTDLAPGTAIISP